MNSCRTIQPLLVLHAEKALTAEEQGHVEAHLATCPACRTEVEEISRIRSWLSDPGLFEPEQNLAWQLLPEKLVARARLAADDRPRKHALHLPKWALGVLALLLVAGGSIWMMRSRVAAPDGAGRAAIASGNQAFLEKMRAVYAREATSQYLSGCQDLLLDLMSAEKSCAGDRYDVALEVSRARQLLDQKRLLENNLSVPEVSRAKGLCDQLEQFLVNLSMSSECETDDSMRNMERFIEKEQLLLRINLLQAGIS
jgi:hypothetical protein